MTDMHCRKDASFGADVKNLIEDRSILPAAKCSSMTPFSGNVRFMRIFAGVPWGGDVERPWAFSLDIGNFRDKASVIILATRDLHRRRSSAFQ